METVITTKIIKQVIEFFRNIPEVKWTKGRRTREEEDGSITHCALGHLDEEFPHSLSYDFSLALNYLAVRKLGISIMSANDGTRLLRYPQSTAKQRVLALLEDLYKTLLEEEQIEAEKAVQQLMKEIKEQTTELVYS